MDELVEVVPAELVLDDGDQVLHQLHALPHAQAEAPVVQSLEVELQGHLVMCSPGGHCFGLLIYIELRTL